jgi:hypothetical protein
MTAFTGCGKTTVDQGPPPPPPSQVSIVFQPEPSGSLAVGFAEPITAVVSNDPNNPSVGVDWVLTCQNPPNCGSLSALHTDNGAPTLYTAPTTLSTNSTVVEVVAYATADHTRNVVAPITISTFSNSLQAGTYVLQAQGVDPNFNPYQFAAAIVLDGNGNITNGEQVANYASAALLDANLTGSYFLGNDGRGLITINTNDNNIGQNGVETFAFVYLSSSQALISQVDIASAQTGVSATGTMDLQASAAVPLGGYAFVVSGTSVAKALPVAFGGIFNIDSTNTISGNGSVTDEIFGKKVNATALGFSGTLTTPDQLGAVTLNLMVPFGAGNKSIPVQFTGYIVDSSHIRLIETDTAAGNPTPFGATGGVAIGQGTATGTFTNTSFAGSYVFGVTGVDLSNANTSPSTLTSAGVFSADASGGLNTGFADNFLQLNCAQVSCTQGGTQGGQISAGLGGTYSMDSSGTGRASLLFSFNPAPKPAYQPEFFFYLTGNGGPALVLQAGDAKYPSLGTGIAYPQSSAAAAFSGDYGLSFVQENGGENDGTGQLNAAAQTLSGVADSSINPGLPSLPDQGFGGSFNPPSSSGPFAGTLVNLNESNAFSVGGITDGLAANYYFIDPEHGFFIETDLVNAATPSGQVSFGYYAARTPVCPSCP